MDVVDAELLEHPQLFHDFFWRADAHAVLVRDMLDAVRAPGRAAAAGHDEGKIAPSSSACDRLRVEADDAAGWEDHSDH